jgi:iron complex outermembrane recepter protein
VVTREEAIFQGFASTTEALQSAAVTGVPRRLTTRTAAMSPSAVRAPTPSPARHEPRPHPGAAERPWGLAGRFARLGRRGLDVLLTAIIDRVEVLHDGAS